MLFDRNPDLRRLRDEGFDLALSQGNNHLAIRGVPYLSGKEVNLGTLIAELNLSGDILNPPKDHVIYFMGDQPCEIDGSIIPGIVNASALRDIDKPLRVCGRFLPAHLSRIRTTTRRSLPTSQFSRRGLRRSNPRRTPEPSLRTK